MVGGRIHSCVPADKFLISVVCISRAISKSSRSPLIFCLHTSSVGSKGFSQGRDIVMYDKGQSAIIKISDVIP
jgi:hypothetical protein